MPVISVIVPVYNVEPYLRECIDSILNQTFKDFELILIDDGSPDGCPLICDDYSKKDNRVVVIHKKNGGLSSARNAGLDYVFKNSNSEFITFVDSDDFLDENYLFLLFEKSGECDFVACDFNIYENSVIKNTANLTTEYRVDNYKEYWSLSSLIHDLLIISCAKLFRKSVFQKIRYPVGLINEDAYVIHEIVGNSKRILILPNKLYYYRQHSRSIMATIDKTSLSFTTNTLELNNHIAKYYASIKDWFFFNKFYKRNLYLLINIYINHPFRLKSYFKTLKILFKKKSKESNLNISIGEKLFFIFPYFYSSINRSKYKKGANQYVEN